MPDTVDTVLWAADDRWYLHLKHVEQFADINKLYIVAFCWIIIDTYYVMHGPLKIKNSYPVFFLNIYSVLKQGIVLS